MRIAAFFYQGQPHVGLVSKDLTSVAPFDLPLADRELGALTLVDTLSKGEALPPQGAAIALKDVQLRAPLPHPRRNIFVSVKTTTHTPKNLPAAVLTAAPKPAAKFQPSPSSFPKCPSASLPRARRSRCLQCQLPLTTKPNWP